MTLDHAPRGVDMRGKKVMPSRQTVLVLIAGITCIWSGGTVAAATAVTINACVKTNGAIRILATEHCKASETPLSLNTQGPPGPQGVPGPAGPPGTPGSKVDMVVS